MARIIDDKLLFIHVAKTGGTFVRETFNYYGVPNRETGVYETEDHYSLSDVLKYHDECRKYLSFGFIRHPADWVQSRWLWAMETNFQEKLQYSEEARQHWMAEVFAPEVELFAENILNRMPGIATKYFKNMLGLETAYEADIIFRYEDMHDSMVKLFHLLYRSVTLEEIKAMPKYKFVKHKYDYKIDSYIRKQLELSEESLMKYYG
jgi:hypothetical protein